MDGQYPPAMPGLGTYYPSGYPPMMPPEAIQHQQQRQQQRQQLQQERTRLHQIQTMSIESLGSFAEFEEPKRAMLPPQPGAPRSRRRPQPGAEHVKHRRTRSGCYTCRQRRVKVRELHVLLTFGRLWLIRMMNSVRRDPSHLRSYVAFFNLASKHTH